MSFEKFWNSNSAPASERPINTLMRMREIIDIVESVQSDDFSAYRQKYCDVFAIVAYRRHALPIIAITDATSGDIRIVCNRIAGETFLTVDGVRTREELFADHGLDPHDPKWMFGPTSEDVLKEKIGGERSQSVYRRAEYAVSRVWPVEDWDGPSLPIVTNPPTPARLRPDTVRQSSTAQLPIPER